jgi:hypothetical protein
VQVGHLDDVLEVAFVAAKPKRRRKTTSGTPKGSEDAPGEDTPGRKGRKPAIDAPGGQDPLPASVRAR